MEYRISLHKSIKKKLKVDASSLCFCAIGKIIRELDILRKKNLQYFVFKRPTINFVAKIAQEVMEKKNAFNTYLDEIADQALLTDAEEQALAERIQAGDQRAVNQLIEPNLRFVVALARQYSGQGVQLDDLVSEGNLGMMKAAMRFSPKVGKRFVKYAAPIIRDAMEKAIQQQAGLYKVPQGEATAAEVRRSHPVSVDAPIPAGSQNNFNLLNLLENHDAPYADSSFQKENTNEILSQALGMLHEREQQVVSLIYGIDGERHTMAEVAEIMQLRRERVRQIRDKALRRLRKVHLDRLF